MPAFVSNRTLNTWLHNAMAQDANEQPISSIVVRHFVNGAPSTIVHTVKFGSKAYQPDSLSHTIMNIVENYCNGLTGVQQFRIEAQYGNSPQAESFFTMRHMGAAYEEGVSEQPDERGKTAQQMRWYDASMVQVFKRQQQLDDATLRTIELQNTLITRMGERLNEVTSENVEAFNVVKDMLARQALGDHEYKMKEIEAQNKAAMMQKAMQMAPPLINQITGREVFPQQSVDSAIMEQVAEAIDPEKLPLLMEALNLNNKPELVAMIMHRFNGVLEKKEQERKHRMAMLAASQNHPDPESDAAGD